MIEDLYIMNPMARYALHVIAMGLQHKALRLQDLDDGAVLDFVLAVKRKMLEEE